MTTAQSDLATPTDPSTTETPTTQQSTVLIEKRCSSVIGYQMDLQTQLDDGISQRSSYIAQIDQAANDEDWVRVCRLSSELETLDIAIQCVKEAIIEGNQRRM